MLRSVDPVLVDIPASVGPHPRGFRSASTGEAGVWSDNGVYQPRGPPAPNAGSGANPFDFVQEAAEAHNADNNDQDEEEPLHAIDLRISKVDESINNCDSSEHVFSSSSSNSATASRRILSAAAARVAARRLSEDGGREAAVWGHHRRPDHESNDEQNRSHRTLYHPAGLHTLGDPRSPPLPPPASTSHRAPSPWGRVERHEYGRGSPSPPPGLPNGGLGGRWSPANSSRPPFEEEGSYNRSTTCKMVENSLRFSPYPSPPSLKQSSYHDEQQQQQQHYRSQLPPLQEHLQQPPPFVKEEPMSPRAPDHQNSLIMRSEKHRLLRSTSFLHHVLQQRSLGKLPPPQTASVKPMLSHPFFATGSGMEPEADSSHDIDRKIEAIEAIGRGSATTKIPLWEHTPRSPSPPSFPKGYQEPPHRRDPDVSPPTAVPPIVAMRNHLLLQYQHRRRMQQAAALAAASASSTPSLGSTGNYSGLRGGSYSPRGSSPSPGGLASSSPPPLEPVSSPSVDDYGMVASPDGCGGGYDRGGHYDPSRGGKRGRPRKHAPKIPLPPLYVFIRNLLHNRAYNPKVISWVSEAQGYFKVNNTAEFARTWGLMKSNRNEEMTYEKMSRAMRYHYGSEKQGRRGHLAMVKEKRLVYQFGELAVNWRTHEVGPVHGCDQHDLCRGSLCLWTKE